MIVRTLIAWLQQFDGISDCDIVMKIIVTTPDKIKYVFSNKGEE